MGALGADPLDRGSNGSASPFGLADPGLVRRHIEWRLGEPTRGFEPLLIFRQQKDPRVGAFLLAGLTGLEPATSSVTGWHSNRLSYNPLRLLHFTSELVGDDGLEPPTCCV